MSKKKKHGLEIELEDEGILRTSRQIDGKSNISYIVSGIDYALGRIAYEKGGYGPWDKVKYKIIIMPKEIAEKSP